MSWPLFNEKTTAGFERGGCDSLDSVLYLFIDSHQLEVAVGSNDLFTLAAHGLEEHVRITTLIFFENHQFHVVYCVTLAYVLFFSKNV